MNRRSRNYLTVCGAFFCLYFALLAVIFAHEQSQQGNTSLMWLWYVLVVILSAAAGFLIFSVIQTRMNEKSLQAAFKSTHAKRNLFVWTAGFGAAGILCASVFLGVLPSFHFSLPAIALNHAPAQEEEEEAEQPDHAFPIPDLPPVKPVQNLIDQAQAVNTVSDTQSFNGVFTADQPGQSVFLAQNQSSLTLTGSYLGKTGEESDPSLAVRYGLNAALIAAAGSTVNVMSTQIETQANGAPGIAVNGALASAAVSDGQIVTRSDSSAGVYAGFQGSVHLGADEIYTFGNASPAVNSLSGAVIGMDDGLIETKGVSSPVIEASGTVTASNINANAYGSSAILLHPGAQVTLNGGSMTAACGSSSQGALGYVSTAPLETSSKKEPAHLVLNDIQIGCNPDSAYRSSTPIFNISSIDALIEMSGVGIDFGSSTILNAQAGKAVLNLGAQSLSGRIAGDASSTLELNLTNGSVFAGSINSDSTCPNVTLHIDGTSRLSLTNDIYCTSFTNDLPDNSNISTNGYHIYVNGQILI